MKAQKGTAMTFMQKMIIGTLVLMILGAAGLMGYVFLAKPANDDELMYIAALLVLGCWGGAAIARIFYKSS
jgi:hypothetical protein